MSWSNAVALHSAALPVTDVDGRVLAAVVQETIFSQLLRLPQNELGVLAYAKVTVSLQITVNIRTLHILQMCTLSVQPGQLGVVHSDSSCSSVPTDAN